MPEEFIQAATDRLARINNAYDLKQTESKQQRTKMTGRLNFGDDVNGLTFSISI